MARGVTATAQTIVPVALRPAWDRFVPIDLTKIFTGLGPLPAVVAVRNQTGPWDQIGESRQPCLSDGSVVTESITEVALPDQGAALFGYTVRGFTGAVGALTAEARGRWHFQEQGTQTLITWAYEFLPRNRLTRPALALVIAILWQRYMRKVMARTGKILAGDDLESGT